MDHMMSRTVAFTENGSIVISGGEAVDVVMSGVVLLTPEEAAMAETFGWEVLEGHPSEKELGFVRVQKEKPMSNRTAQRKIEIMNAARAGIRRFIESTRGANLLGAACGLNQVSDEITVMCDGEQFKITIRHE
jgi:hypothetical protein